MTAVLSSPLLGLYPFNRLDCLAQFTVLTADCLILCDEDTVTSTVHGLLLKTE